MGMQLPDDLVEVLDLVGVDWPQIDEDEVKASAKDYRNLAEGIRDAVKEGNNACSHIVGGKSKGETVKAIDRRWGTLTTRDLATFANRCDDLAGALDSCADLIVGCKIAIITKLTATAATATAGVVGMFFTAGLSGLLSAAAIGAARLIIQEAIDYAIDQITTIVTDKIEGKVLAEIEKLFTTGGTYDVMASGSADMAQDLVIEFDEFEQAAGGYQETATNFDKKKGTFKEGGAQRKTSVKKDSRFHKLATAMDKAEDAVEKKADEMVKTLEDHGGKIDKSKGDHKGTDAGAKEEIDKCKVDKHDADDVPMYLLNADGSVQVLLPSGDTEKLSKSDDSGIWNILDKKDGTAWRPAPREKHDWNVPQTRKGPKVTSTKIEPGSTDLSRATEIARYAKNDYRGTNFAAGRYVDPDTGREMILVGDSQGPHSERTIGYPLLKNGREAGLQEVYTEREPCQLSPKCDQWLDLHFKSKNPNLEVTHANDYDQTEKSLYKRDIEHRKYMEALEKRHKDQGHP
ncbi:nucleic acid/nucleotide deaminase domain-containing protein [Streptomyces sp. NRRL S-118]|uniref:WXG100-like domain-containing protein n=1 Tax=Streptomyces sp. NRRL S-118 TaxID=1463881 RepID=UPI0004C91798|nr:nucleic acid/nucleotide deaminase domain-containing protein [Streptomyces sp. NRRL S-118]